MGAKMTLIFNVSNYLIENEESLAVEIVEGVLHRMKLEIPKWEKEQAITMYIEFMRFLGESLINDEEGVPQGLLIWSKKNAEGQVSSGGKISEIVARYPSTREIFIEILTRISLEFGLSIKETTFIIKRINAMLDISLNETVFAFERFTDKFIDETQREMAELSAPIVPIKEGIAVLPLIGVIDSYRATYILEKVVPKISELQIDHLIADFSGILTIDIEIARYLFRIENILRLLGINTIVTGLRPELVQIVVKDGIDMSSFKTFAHVKQALESIK
jgi:rsbT co-antagonist protein RsbR